MNADDKDNEIRPDNANSDTKGNDPCLRCGAPVEINGEMLCRKCEKEVH
jgi:ribosomal protein S14